jgi:hypothetical protein
MAERGAATRGKVAKQVAGSDDVELKATVPHKQIHWSLKRYNLTTSNDEERFIYFFDTPELDLFHAGVVLRARRIVGGEHDSTVKLRPVDPKRVPNEWKRYKGFKIESDASENGIVTSASFTMPVAKGAIKRVASGELGVAALLTDEQRRFLRDVAKLEFELSRLHIMGPMRAQRWKFSDPALPWPITAELWRRDDGALILEASIKAPVEQAAVAAGGFLAHLAEIGAERDHAQEAKTRWALDHYAGRARSLGATKPPGKAARKSAKKAAAKPPAKKAGGKKKAGRKTAVTKTAKRAKAAVRKIAKPLPKALPARRKAAGKSKRKS